MKQNDLSARINEYIKEMPSLPASAGKITEICNKVNVNPSDLNRLISLDPVLRGRLLQLVNSTYHGHGHHVTSPIKAVTMLGINTLKNFLLSTASSVPVKNENDGMSMKDFWRHSLCAGIIAKLLAAKQNVDSTLHEEYFTAGLLHDIGKIPLNALMPSQYKLALAAAERGKKTLLEAEEKTLSLNHCTAGAMIAGSWKLDWPVADVIIHHHNPALYSGENANILYTVSIANYFSSKNIAPGAGYINPEKPANIIWETLSVKEDVFEELKESINQKIKKAEIFLHLS
jgi:putative nucleotidyltransferase with HDIG domain